MAITLCLLAKLFACGEFTGGWKGLKSEPSVHFCLLLVLCSEKRQRGGLGSAGFVQPARSHNRKCFPVTESSRSPFCGHRSLLNTAECPLGIASLWLRSASCWFSRESGREDSAQIASHQVPSCPGGCSPLCTLLSRIIGVSHWWNWRRRVPPLVFPRVRLKREGCPNKSSRIIPPEGGLEMDAFFFVTSASQ